MRLPSTLLTFVLALLLPAFAVADARAPTRHDLVADGHTFALWEKRPAKPRGSVLLIHGRTWSALPNFDLQVAGVERSVMNGLNTAEYTAYALDLRGYGDTPRDSTGWLTPDRAAADVRAALEWIRKANPGELPLTLLGYSRGASISALVAARYPESLSLLVLYAFPAVPRQPTVLPAAPLREPTTAKAAASDFITPGAASQAVIDAYVSQALKANPVRVDWREENQFAFEPKAIRAPTLIIYGARDPLYSPDAISKLLGALGTEDRTLVLLPNSDHAAHVENAHEAWLHAVVEFISRER
jgi:pimeloyl-ACP methyl ester carboxylesterase